MEPVPVLAKCLKALANNPSENEETIAEVLQSLSKATMTKALLQETKVGVTVNQLRKSLSPASSALASELISRWKNLVGANGKAKPKPNASNASSSISPSPSASPSPSPSPSPLPSPSSSVPPSLSPSPSPSPTPSSSPPPLASQPPSSSSSPSLKSSSQSRSFSSPSLRPSPPPSSSFSSSLPSSPSLSSVSSKPSPLRPVPSRPSSSTSTATATASSTSTAPKRTLTRLSSATSRSSSPSTLSPSPPPRSTTAPPPFSLSSSSKPSSSRIPSSSSSSSSSSFSSSLHRSASLDDDELHDHGGYEMDHDHDGSDEDDANGHDDGDALRRLHSLSQLASQTKPPPSSSSFSSSSSSSSSSHHRHHHQHQSEEEEEKEGETEREEEEEQDVLSTKGSLIDFNAPDLTKRRAETHIEEFDEMAEAVPTGAPLGYDGNSGSVPSLVELCLTRLSNNLDQLPHLGEMPTALVLHILHRASVPQLQRVEAMNPQLSPEDLDVLWKPHCLRIHPYIKTELQKPEGLMWRELYLDAERAEREKMASFGKRFREKRQREEEEKRESSVKLLSQAVVKKKMKTMGSGPSMPKKMAQRNDLFADAKRQAVRKQQMLHVPSASEVKRKLGGPGAMRSSSSSSLQPMALGRRPGAGPPGSYRR